MQQQQQHTSFQGDVWRVKSEANDLPSGSTPTTYLVGGVGERHFQWESPCSLFPVLSTSLGMGNPRWVLRTKFYLSNVTS